MFSGLGQATYFSAICIQSQGLPKLQVQINKGDLSATTVENQLQLIIDGNMTDINLIEQDSNTTQELVGVTSDILFKRTNASLTVFLSSGISVTIESKTVSKAELSGKVLCCPNMYLYMHLFIQLCNRLSSYYQVILLTLMFNL